MPEKRPPKIKTIKKWKESFKWLKFVDGMKMVCTFKAHEEKLRLMPDANLTFVTGSTNYRPSTLKDHEQTNGHKKKKKQKKRQSTRKPKLREVNYHLERFLKISLLQTSLLLKSYKK